MKKIIVICILLFSSAISAADITSKDKEIVISDNLKLGTKIIDDENKAGRYIINIKYPLLSGQFNDHAQTFNREINHFLISQQSDFKKQIKENARFAKNLPPDINQNGLYIDYAATVIHPDHHRLLSVRFNMEPYMAGSAHPAHQVQVFNFDLSTGKELTLNDIFSPHSDYLKLIATYCNAQLKHKLKDSSDIEQINAGSAAKADNYRHWNVKSDGILIIFDTYQVAAYVFGQQEVLVPYSLLGAVIPATSPVAACVKNPHAC